MSATLYIGTKSYSSWSLRPWLAAKKAGIVFEEKLIELGQADTKANIQAVSPSAKVPCWVEDDLVIWDSLAICEYLAERAPQLLPKDAKQRAVMRSICAEVHSQFAALRNEMSMQVQLENQQVELSPEAEHDLKRLTDIVRMCRERKYSQIGQWLFGEFSLADAMFSPLATRLTTYQVAVDAKLRDYKRVFYDDALFMQWIEAAKQEQLAPRAY